MSPIVLLACRLYAWQRQRQHWDRRTLATHLSFLDYPFSQALSPSKTSVSHWQRCGCLRRPAERRAHRLLCHCRADFMPGSVSGGIETVEHWQRISASRLPVYPQRAQVRLLYPSITDGVSTTSDAIPVTYCSSNAPDCMPSCVSGGIRAHGTLHLFCALQSLRV